jgi:hypothetical protein
MKDTLEQLAAEVTAANDDLNLGNHDNDLQRLRELESDREDLIERINAREERLHVARTALLSFMSPETQPEQSAPVAAPESAGRRELQPDVNSAAFRDPDGEVSGPTSFTQTQPADAWTPGPDTKIVSGEPWPSDPVPDENTQLHRTDAGETPGF